MKNLITIYLVFLFNIYGCSDNNDTQEKKNHVWKEQTEAIEKARSVEGILKDSAEEQRRQIKEQLE